MIPLKAAIVLLGVLSLVGSSKVDTRKCPKRHGFFPKPGSLCKAYYRCSNWIPVEEICPEGQLFNPVASWCDWIDVFVCLDKPKRKECPRDNGRFLKPGTECKVYYDCCNGEPTERSCPREQLFDPSQSRCEWMELYTCVEDLSTDSPTVSITSTTFEILTSTKSDDNQNYKTSDGISQPTSSPPSTRSSPGITGSSSVHTRASSFSDYQSTSQRHSSTSSYTSSGPNIRTSPDVSRSSSTYESTSSSSDYQPTSHTSTGSYATSDPTAQSSTGVFEPSSTHSSTPSSSDYQSTSQRHTSSYTEPKPKIPTSTRVMRSSVADVSSTTTVNIFCPEPSGYFPHPTDKHKFVGCVNDVPNVLTCPSNLVYNHKIRQCDYEKLF